MEHPAATSWPRFLLLLAGGIATGIHIGKVPPALPLLQAELGLDLVASGWILSLVAAVGAFGAMPAGAAADAFGHRRTILVGLTLLTVGSLIGAVSGGPLLLMTERVLEGAGSVLVAVSSPPLIMRLTAQRHARLAFGLWGAWMPLGVASIMVIFPAVEAAWGWRGGWLAAAAVSAAVAIAVFRLPTVIVHKVSRPSFKDFLIVARAPGPSTLAAAFFCFSFCFMTVFGFLPAFLHETQGVALDRATIVVAIAVAINGPANVLAGWLAARGMPRWTLLATAFVGMGACSFAIFAPALPDWLRYGAMFVYSAVGGLLPASTIAGGAALAPSRSLIASSTGLVMQGAYCGMLIGPPLLGMWVSQAGWNAAPFFIAAACATGLAVTWRLRRLERRVRQDMSR